MLGSKSYCGERGRSVRVVLYENHPAAPEGEGLVNRDWPRRVAIGAQGRAVIMIVVEAILGRQLVVIARVRDPTPGHVLIEQSDETLDVAGVECCCQGCSVGRHEILDCTHLAAELVPTQNAPITQLLPPTDVPVSAARKTQVDRPRRVPPGSELETGTSGGRRGAASARSVGQLV